VFGEPGSQRRRNCIVAVAIVVLLAVIFLAVKPLPDWLANTNGLEPADARAEVGRVRTALLASLAGLIAALGAVLSSMTYRLNSRVAADTHERDLQAQVTERFTRAIDQLGNRDNLDVRLGGIYGLERIARDSAAERQQVIEVLTAFLREHATWEEANPRTTVTPATDVQAIVTVLGRMPDMPPRPLDLRCIDLQGADLTEGEFRGALFHSANLGSARLHQTRLEKAVLEDANLTNADLRRARLEAANLTAANLTGAVVVNTSLGQAHLAAVKLQAARLSGVDAREARAYGADFSNAHIVEVSFVNAHLDGANFTGATLFGVDFQGARLVGARFCGAHLRETNLQQADLRGADLVDVDIDPPGSLAVIQPTSFRGAVVNEDTKVNSIDLIALGARLLRDEPGPPPS
jgi:uncharacterized protein YjbI with pentapeptide repeats